MRPDSYSLNPYEVLGIPSNASIAEIQAAYRQHALRWHPDRNPNDEYAMRMMQRVNAAWAILKEEQSRSAYDRWERGEERSASGPQAWRRPRADSAPGREWYRPPSSSAACPRCQRFNEPESDHCTACGFRMADIKQPDADTISKTDQPGGFGVRLVASLVDLAAVYGLLFGFLLSMNLPIFDQVDFDKALPPPMPMVSLILLTCAYFTFTVSLGGSTIGKWFSKVKVVRVDGSKVGLGRAFVRFWFTVVSLLLLGIGFFVIAFRRDKRGLHDLVCDTKVVYR